MHRRAAAFEYPRSSLRFLLSSSRARPLLSPQPRPLSPPYCSRSRSPAQVVTRKSHADASRADIEKAGSSRRRMSRMGGRISEMRSERGGGSGPLKSNLDPLKRLPRELTASGKPAPLRRVQSDPLLRANSQDSGDESSDPLPPPGGVGEGGGGRTRAVTRIDSPLPPQTS